MNQRPLREELADMLDGFDIHAREPFLRQVEQLYANDVSFRDPMQAAKGLEAFLEVNRRMGKGAKAVRFRVADTLGDDELFYLHWTMTFEPRFGPKLSLEGVSRIRAKDRRIFEHHDYWDLGELFLSAIPGGQRLLRVFFRPFV
jgi:hypothetical protein